MLSTRLSHYNFSPGLTYLNHGAFGAIPKAVVADQRRWRAEVDANPVRFFHSAYAGHLDASRSALAALVGTSPDALAFVCNASEGMSAVLRSIHFEAGDEVVTTSLGYDSVDNAVNQIVAPQGGKHLKARVELPLSKTSDIVEAVERVLSSKTRLLIVDHIASRSAIVFPIAELIATAKAKCGDKIAILVDGAHAPAALSLSLASVDADFYVGNAHKWLSAGRGTAFVVAKEAWRGQLRPPTLSHGATWKRPGRSRFHDEFDWTGTRDPAAWLSVPSAIAFLEELHPSGLQGIRHDSETLCRSAVDALVGLGCLSVAPPTAFACMATVKVGAARPGTEMDVARALAATLYDEHQIEMTVFGSDASVFVRASFWAYNDPTDVGSLVRAISEWQTRSSSDGKLNGGVDVG